MTSYFVCEHNRHRERIDAVELRRKFWLFGPQVEKATSYIGSGTVWHDKATGKRCDTPTEALLADVWQKWNNERQAD